MDDLPTIAQSLYTLPQSEFTARRNALARTAKDEGSAELADGIRTLPKASAAAWVVNAFQVHRPDEVAQLIGLGEALRDAQQNLDPDALRSLGQQRRKVVSALAQSASAVAEQLGQRVSPSVVVEVEQTLQAALADADAAAAVTSGRLVRSLVSAGLDDVDLEGAVAAGARASSSRALASSASMKTGNRDDARREAARRALSEAQAAADASELAATEATDTLTKLERRATEAADRREDLEAELDELRDQLAALERDIEASDRDIRSLARERATAERASEQARREADRAKEKLSRLSDTDG